MNATERTFSLSQKDERGYIVVETVGSFMLFTFLMVSILSLINLVAVQSRMHFALTETAQVISMYSYVLEVTGAADHIQNLSRKADTVRVESGEFKKNLNAILDILNDEKSFKVSEWKASVDAVEENAKALGSRGESWLNDITADPKASLQLIMSYGVDELSSEVVERLMYPLMNHYLGNGMMSGDEFLRRFNVQGGVSSLSFHTFDLLKLDHTGDTNTRLLDADGNVRLVVQYDIDYTFGALPLPFRPTLHVTQEVVTKAWLGGVGKGYQG